MMILPTNDHVVVEISERKSPIKQVKDLEDSIQEGRVVYIPDAPNSAECNVGDIVRWEKFAEADGKFSHENRTLCAIKAKQIMVVFRHGKESK